MWLAVFKLFFRYETSFAEVKLRHKTKTLKKVSSASSRPYPTMPSLLLNFTEQWTRDFIKLAPLFTFELRLCFFNTKSSARFNHAISHISTFRFLIRSKSTFGPAAVSATSRAAIAPIFSQSRSTDGSGPLSCRSWQPPPIVARTIGPKTAASAFHSPTTANYSRAAPTRTAWPFSTTSTTTESTGMTSVSSHAAAFPLSSNIWVNKIKMLLRSVSSRQALGLRGEWCKSELFAFKINFILTASLHLQALLKYVRYTNPNLRI